MYLFFKNLQSTVLDLLVELPKYHDTVCYKESCTPLPQRNSAVQHTLQKNLFVFLKKRI